MRKLMIVVALAAVALGGAACTQAPTPTSTSSPATTTTPPAADETKAVCTEALTYSSDKATKLEDIYTQLLAAVTAQDLAKVQSLGAEGKAVLSEWETKYGELSGKSIKPEVKAALDETKDYVHQLNGTTNTADATQVRTKFTELTLKLTTACANS